MASLLSCDEQAFSVSNGMKDLLYEVAIAVARRNAVLSAISRMAEQPGRGMKSDDTTEPELARRG